ncbi:MAG: WD40/YVTN/BNR-like repeat-containing protein [Candidatus Binataceae bacterium]
MKLCIGTSKGIVVLDAERRGKPLMVLADPPSVWCMAQDCRDPGTIYAGSVDHTHMGSARGRMTLARSIDGGRTWADITPGIARNEDVWAIAAPPDAPGEVFIGTSHARLLRSLDHGRTFRECAAFLKLPGHDRWSFPPPPHVAHVRSIVFDPHDSATLYVGVEEGGIARSRDRGETFELLNSGLYEDVHCIAVDPQNPKRLYATTGAGFYISETRGSSWSRIKRGLCRSYAVPLLVTAGEQSRVFTAAAAGPPPFWSAGPAGADAVIFRSLDAGQSFEALGDDVLPERGMVMRFEADPESEGDFFAVTTGGCVIRTREMAETATLIGERLPPAYDLVTLP